VAKKAIILSGLAGFVIAGAAALISAQIVEDTSTPQFCASCHEMKPMYETWLTGPHGPLGNKDRAIRATCVDCHLPHDSVVSYLLAKASSGTKDFMGHLFGGSDINSPKYWLEKLNESDRYVYVESCRRCHQILPNNRAHEEIKSGKISGNCLRCHWYVGHGEELEVKIKELSQR